jgi:hypothetical protein
MTLRWTTIDLPWAGGVDDKRHPYLRELPKAESLINLRFQQSGAWSARDGYTNLGGPAQQPDVGFRWGDVLAQTADSTWLLDQPGGNWRELGFTGPRAVGVAQRPILRTQEGASTVACAVVNGHALHAWTRSPLSAVYVLVRNLETGVVVYGPTTIASLDVAAPYAASLRAVAHENSYATVFASAGGASVNAVTFSITAAGTVTVGTASALAKFYQAAIGSIPSPFSAHLRQALATPRSSGDDRVLLRPTVFTCGAQQDPRDDTGRKIRRIYGPSISAFGHPGAGGSHGMGDPETGVSFAYVMNQMDLSVMPGLKCLEMVDALFSEM